MLHLSTYASNGGAARAATALHHAMLQEGVDSTLQVASGTRFRIAGELDRRLWRLQKSAVNTWRSPARFGSLSAKQINESDADVVNLHWVTDGFLTIEQIGRITKPIVWTLYDMWPFCGTEHYGVDSQSARWRTGYTKANRSPQDSGIDLDRDAWRRKQRSWRPAHVVPASTWLTNAAHRSALMQDWPITRIPHVIDTNAFAPMTQHEARVALGLPNGVPLILFLASAGIHDARKGFDLLQQALPEVRRNHPSVVVMVVGPPDEHYASPSGTPIIWHGLAHGDTELRQLYCAADVTAVPSREDNMPLTAMEATTCGKPVVGFNIGGLPDIVQHQTTGYLAEPFDIRQLSEGLTQALDDSLHDQRWSTQARDRAVETWSAEAVVPQYLHVYDQAIDKAALN